MARTLTQIIQDGLEWLDKVLGAGVEDFPRWFWANSFLIGLLLLGVAFYLLGKREGEW